MLPLQLVKTQVIYLKIYLLQEPEDGSSEKKTTFWKKTSGGEVLAGEAQKNEDDKKTHLKSLTGSVKVMGEENGDHFVDATGNEELNRLREKENRLVNEIQELREQNELLEFRLLELEYYNMNSTNRVSVTAILIVHSWLPHMETTSGTCKLK